MGKLLLTSLLKVKQKRKNLPLKVSDFSQRIINIYQERLI